MKRILLFLCFYSVQPMVPQPVDDTDYELWYIEVLLSNLEKPFDENSQITNHRQILQLLKDMCQNYKERHSYQPPLITELFNEPDHEQEPPSDNEDE